MISSVARSATRQAAWLIALAVPAGAVPPSDVACTAMDPEIRYCPAPDVPRITELQEGTLTLELEIGSDGAVRTSRVVAASGHPAWQASARTAVASWRYVAGPALRFRRVPFDFRAARP